MNGGVRQGSRPSIEVDVVILTWNDGDLLERAMTSALDAEGVDVRVYVVDNGSDPAAIVPDDPRVHLIRNEANLGVAPARNQGVAAGSSPLVCILDSDAELVPDCLALLAAQVLTAPDVGMAVPVFLDQVPEASAGPAPSVVTKIARVTNVRDTYVEVDHGDLGAWPVDFGIGACQFFRRVAFEGVGGLDDSYFYGPEDVDFCLRLREQGWSIWQVAGARCLHPPRRRFRGLLTARGMQHAWAVTRHLWRHRNFHAVVDR